MAGIVPVMDFSPIGNLANVYRSAQRERMRQDALQQFAQGGAVDPNVLLQSGDPTLANLALTYKTRQDAQARQAQLDARQIERDKIEDAFRRQQLGQTANYQNRSLSIQEAAAKRKERSLVDDASEREAIARKLGMEPGSPAFTTFVATGKTGRDEALTAGDRKAINAAEDDLPDILGTVEALKEAKNLNKKTFSGITAGARAYIGSNVPGGGMLVDKGAADATTEWQKIMGPEALKTMASTLKGATTDFELRKFIEMLADPTTKPEIRERVIDRMIKLGERQQALAERRIRDMRGGTYYKPGYGQATTPTAAPAGNDALNQARDAIARGADRNAVIRRLQQNGIDPSGL